MSATDILNELSILKSSSDCYRNRIKSLEAIGRDPTLIKDGIADVLRVLERGARSFVVYGEPQSGKTEFMIALVCRLLDLGKKTIFVIMNDNTELETRNFDRFHMAQELNPTPERDFQILNMDISNLQTVKQRVIFCRKNARNLEKLIYACRFMKDRVIIDDEADYATPNARINKDEVTAINMGVQQLGNLNENEDGIYIGVTATPARLDLNNTFLNNSKDWVFLNSHNNYKGRKFFFPVTENERAASDYNLVKLPDETDNPKLLRHAVFRFLLRVSMLNSPINSATTAYSMLVHTAGKTNDHLMDEKDLLKILQVLSDQSHKKLMQYTEELLKIAILLVQQHRSDTSPKELVLFVLQNIGKSEVLVINHKNDSGNVKRAGNPKAMFTFAIGGNIVSRGLTFENLLTFYFSRTVKGKLQQNTYIQRARMFGNRPYSQYFELCVPQSLFNQWATVFEDHEISLRLARAGAYLHIQSKGTAVIDAGAIDRSNVTMESSERVVGDIFELTEELELRLVNHNQSCTVSFLKQLIDEGLLTEKHLPNSLITYLVEVCPSDESDVLLVLRRENELPKIQNIESYKDGNPGTITRRRGGIVHAMLNRLPDYAKHRHFILPVKNANGHARFLYKSKVGETILQNLKVQKATI